MKKIFLTLLLSAGLFAQGFDGVSLGLADNYTVISRGVQALNYNPANVALPRGNVFELNLIGLNIGLFNNTFSLNDYNNFFVTGGVENRWDNQKKKDFLDLFPQSGLTLQSNIVANAMGFAFNNFALAVQPVVVGRFNTFEDKSPLEIALFGDTYSRNYQRNFENLLHGSTFAGLKVSLAYGYPILQIQKFLPDFSYLAVGIGINYYISMAVAEVEESNVSIQRTQFDDYEIDEFTLNAKARTAFSEGAGPVGKGRGINFGLSTQFKKDWQFSLSFIDLFGSMKISSNAERHKISEYYRIKIYQDTDLDPETSDSSTDTSETIDAFDVDVPTTMRFGAAYQFKKNLIFTAEYVQGLDHAFGNSTTPRIGAGVYYKPFWWLPVRGGFSLGGNSGFLLALGSGIDLKYLNFDFSFAMKNALWPTHSEGLFGALSLMLKL